MTFPYTQGALLLFFLLVVASGCHSRGRTNHAEEASSLKPIAKFYGDFVNQHQGRPPRDEAAFKAFLKETKNAEILLAEFKISDPDSMFISGRDKQPYVVFYGNISRTSGPGGAPVVAYEKVGVGGKRFVASALGAVQEVDEAEFRKMVPEGS